MHGLSKAVETLYKSEILKKDFEFIKVDITNNKKFLSNYKLIKKADADLFYLTISQSTGGNIRDLLIMHLLYKQGKKCLIHLHGGYYRKLYEKKMPEFQKRLNKMALSHVSGAIVLGNSLKYIFDGLVEKKKVYVIPNCVDDEFLISEEELESKISKTNDVYHVLYLSNLIRSKGYDIVLEMAKEYKNNPGTKKLHFDFAGKFYGAEEKQFFENYIEENGLQDAVTYHGIVSGDAKRKLLKQSTFFALPTKYPKEGQPISILEAMGNGLIILTTNHAGIPDVVQDHINGCVGNLDQNIGKAYRDYIETVKDEDIANISKGNYLEVKKHYLENTYISNMAKCFHLMTEGE